jgi:hypothetical protein
MLKPSVLSQERESTRRAEGGGRVGTRRHHHHRWRQVEVVGPRRTGHHHWWRPHPSSHLIEPHTCTSHTHSGSQHPARRHFILPAREIARSALRQRKVPSGGSRPRGNTRTTGALACAVVRCSVGGRRDKTSYSRVLLRVAALHTLPTRWCELRAADLSSIAAGGVARARLHTPVVGGTVAAAWPPTWTRPRRPCAPAAAATASPT